MEPQEEVMPDFLLEIGTEEIPAGYLDPAASALVETAREALSTARLVAREARTLYAPRRITLFLTGIPESQEDFSESVQGPSQKIAFDESGKPTKAAAGFARGQGVDLAALEVRDTRNGPYVFARKLVKGSSARDVLSKIIPELVSRLPFPKSMHWTDPDFTFARPIRSVLALLGDEVVPFTVGGVASGRKTWGHPFLAPGPMELQSARLDAYRDALRKAFVVVDVEERRDLIRTQIEKLLAAHGASLAEFELLDEVTNLVEFPNAVEGSFPERFLKVPDAVVKAAMMEHQRYFPVRDASGKLVNRFITVTNRPPEHAADIRRGNERVLNARLSDAEFFWREDRKSPLESFGQRLSGVMFQEKLGSYADRVRRLGELGLFIAARLGCPDEVSARVKRAALLSKADLVTQMVGEFPSLQGIVGSEYARADGEDPEVAQAIAEHYQPRSARDALPESLVGKILALADKFDSLVGCFAAGLAPTGSQDPYALRRQTAGILRIILTGRLVLPLKGILAKAKELLPLGLPQAARVEEDVTAFVQDRLYYYFLDASFPHDIIRAVLKPGFDDLLDLSRRLESLNALTGTHDWHKLVTAVERTHNITRDFTPKGDVDESLLAEPEERELFRLYAATRDTIVHLIDEHKYAEVCDLYETTFAVPLHVLFEKVYVNVPDEKLRANRLTLLKNINRLFADRVADLSQILIEDR
jgi:glycyl-tRNA synthetase beta chain